MRRVTRIGGRLATISLALAALIACGSTNATSETVHAAEAPAPPARVVNLGRPKAEPPLDAAPIQAPSDAGSSFAANAAASANVTLARLVGSEQEILALYLATKGQPAGAALAVRAAYQLATLKKGAGDKATWMKNVVLAWEFLLAHGEPSAEKRSLAHERPFADYGAEAAFTLLDDDIHRKWDASPTRKTYVGAIDDIRGKRDVKTQALTPGAYGKDAQDADTYDKALEQIGLTYPSVEWKAIALARQGSLYESLRSGLDTTPLPPAGYFTPQQNAGLTSMQNAGQTAEVAEIRTRAAEGWRTWRAQALEDAERAMVPRYAAAVFLARKYDLKNAAVANATSKLAHYVDVLGEAKIREYVSSTVNPEDASTKLEYRDGMYK